MVFDTSSLDTLMPFSRPFGPPASLPSFLKHRCSEDYRSPPPLNLNLSIPTPLPAWASLPTPPMSGTPPPEHVLDPHQIAGRRRKREETPPRRSQESTQPAAIGSTISPLIEQTAHRHGESVRTGRPVDSSLYPPTLILPWEQHPVGFAGGGGQGYALVTSSLPPRPPQVSPRPTRKVKAHVASACVNCKRKHLRCDESRPCRRCVQSGKEDTCRDVEHKKRGRPPLKPDDGSSGRLMSGGMSLPPLGSASARTTLGSGLVPLLPTPTPSRMPYAPSYAAPTIAQSTATAHGQFSGSQPQFNFPPTRDPMPYASHHSTLGHVPSYQYYGQGRSPPTYSPSTQPNLNFAQTHAIPHSMANAGSGYMAAPLQLPPILPAPPGINTDPAIAQQQRQFQPPAQQHLLSSSLIMPPLQTIPSSEEREAKRPKMDMRNILGPRE